MKNKEVRYHIFNIAQEVIHPYTGEVLLSAEKITEALTTHTSKLRYAYILHDKDVYSADEAAKRNENKRQYWGRMHDLDAGFDADLWSHIKPRLLANIKDYLRDPNNEEILSAVEKYQNGDRSENVTAVITALNNAFASQDKNVIVTRDEYIAAKCPEEEMVHAGDPKPPHYHIVVQTEDAYAASTIANWFGIEPQYVDIPKGKDKHKFADCVRYLTHESDKEQAKGKHLYADEEVHANFEFRDLIDHADAVQNIDSASEKDRMRAEVLIHGKTLAQCRAENPLLYADDMEKLKKLRADFLATVPMPPIRINYYIEGAGGIGKGTLSRLLAKQLFPNLEDDECFFEVGASGVALDGYDGQPVIIWHDRRAASLIQELSGRGNVFNVFDVHPARIRQNVKYSCATLVNAVNIIDGIESYADFLDGLAGEYTDRFNVEHIAEDKSQSYRRFPMIICLRENDFDCLVNKGFAEGTREFEQYICYRNVVGNFGKVMAKLDGAARDKVVIDMTKPITDMHGQLLANVEKKITEIDDIPDEFKNYGRSVEDAVRVELLPDAGRDPLGKEYWDKDKAYHEEHINDLAEYLKQFSVYGGDVENNDDESPFR